MLSGLKRCIKVKNVVMVQKVESGNALTTTTTLTTLTTTTFATKQFLQQL
jgi:hypothetical protein